MVFPHFPHSSIGTLSLPVLTIPQDAHNIQSSGFQHIPPCIQIIFPRTGIPESCREEKRGSCRSSIQTPSMSFTPLPQNPFADSAAVFFPAPNLQPRWATGAGAVRTPGAASWALAASGPWPTPWHPGWMGLGWLHLTWGKKHVYQRPINKFRTHVWKKGSNMYQIISLQCTVKEFSEFKLYPKRGREHTNQW